MGASLVGLALANAGPRLGRHHSARVALVRMALTAKDTDAEPLYFGGWRPIAHALGLGGTNESKRTAVSKLWLTLKDEGLIAPNKDSERGGRNGVWVLKVDAWDQSQPTLPVDIDRQAAKTVGP